MRILTFSSSCILDQEDRVLAAAGQLASEGTSAWFGQGLELLHGSIKAERRVPFVSPGVQGFLQKAGSLCGDRLRRY